MVIRKCDLYLVSVVKYLIVIITFFLVCSCKEKEYNTTKAFVYRVDSYHWGYGNFKLRVNYRYHLNGINYEDSFKYKQGRIYHNKKFEEGDSVLIKFQKNKPWKSEFIKMGYDKDYMEGLIKVD
jgi:hypothetical protein